MELGLPDALTLLERLAVALAAGLLIGLERGWHDRDLPEGGRVAGFRTFAVVGLVGGMSALLALRFDGWLLVAGFLAVGLVTAAGHWRARTQADDIGITSMVALLATFAFGAMAGLGELAAAGAGAVIVAVLLGIKPELHHLVARIERPELLATLRLLVISVVLLPILPNQGFGPWDAFNPYRLWWMVVLIAGISYIGYFAIKLLGERRGILATALLGGLTSSTVVAVNFARLAHKRKTREGLLAGGIVIASATMFPRLLVILAIVAPALAGALLWPLLAAALVAYGGGALLVWRAGRGNRHPDEEGLAPGNPLDLKSALLFGLLLATIFIVARGAQAWLGDPGLYLVAGLSGLGDVDAIALSLGSMTREGALGTGFAGGAVLLAVASNAVVKAGLAGALGRPMLGLRVGAAFAVALGAGAAAWLALGGPGG